MAEEKKDEGPKDILANPAPLGLMGFGMTTILLNIHNAGGYGLGSMILAMGLFYGGFAQIIAGIMSFRKGNTFATTAFTSYGLFWLSLVFLLVFPEIGWGAKPEAGALSAYFFMWGVFTAWMYISTLKSNKVLQFVFASLALLFFLLALMEAMKAGGASDSSIESLTHALGIEGIICGFSAVYLAMAEVANETHGKEVFPIFEPEE